MVEEALGTMISILERRSFSATTSDLRHLLVFWKKARTRIYSDERHRADFIQSFNNIKMNTLRNEFSESHAGRVSLELFDEVDNLFSRLTNSERGVELSRIFSKTDLLKEKSESAETDHKLKTLFAIAKNLESEPRFYILCYAFMTAMEGYYDELIRFVYLTEQFLLTREILDPDWLKFEDVGRMYPKLSVRSPNMTAIWESGHNVRNAIAHARFFFDEGSKSMRFVDVIPGEHRVRFEKSLTFAQLADMYSAVRVLGAAVWVLINMLFIFFLLIIPPERIVLVGGPKNTT
jgi:hypothetical protein